MSRRATNVLAVLLIAVAMVGAPSSQAAGSDRVLYVRQSVGDDGNDGLSPQSAWRTLTQLARQVRRGDTAYVGPGLYREQLVPANGGTPEQRVAIIADPPGEITGDAPGVVVIAGSDPVDEQVFAVYEPAATDGTEKAPMSGTIYHARVPGGAVKGVVEMDGPQRHYANATETTAHLRDGVPPLEVVAALPSSFHVDEQGVLFLHTGDGRPPSEHEIEIVRRSGIELWGKPYVSVVGFTIRHTKAAGITFGNGSHGGIATANTVFGSHQGIRVQRSTGVVLGANTLFRNDNSGLYFLAGSTGGVAVLNVVFENVKGIRWGSESNSGFAVGNRAFENSQAGISIEQVQGLRLAGNSLVLNGEVQLNLIQSEYEGEDNCFATSGPEHVLVKSGPWTSFTTLADYQKATGNEGGSREARQSPCRALPDKP